MRSKRLEDFEIRSNPEGFARRHRGEGLELGRWGLPIPLGEIIRLQFEPAVRLADCPDPRAGRTGVGKIQAAHSDG